MRGCEGAQMVRSFPASSFRLVTPYGTYGLADFERVLTARISRRCVSCERVESRVYPYVILLLQIHNYGKYCEIAIVNTQL